MKQDRRHVPLLIARGSLLAAVAGWLIFVTVGTGFSTVMEDRRPDLALRYSPSNPEALVNQGALLLQKATPDAIAAARELALEALRRSPIKSTAYAILGFVADIERKPAQAQRLLNVSQSLNRRDLFMHLWFIEHLSAKGDVAGTLAHYDMALTTSAAAHALLMPILIDATRDPAIQTGLVPILSRQPVWGNAFVRDFIARSDAPLAVAALAGRMRRSGHPLAPSRQVELAERLVREKLFAAAAAVMGRSEMRATVTDGDFAQSDAAGPFAWNLVSTYGYGATRERQVADGAGSVLAFFANRDATGEVARQLMILPAGRYRLTTTASYAPSSANGKPTWHVRCADGDGGEVAALDIPAGSVPARAATAFSVPAGCSAQWLVLQLHQPGGFDGISGQVSRVAIDPVG